MLAMFYSSIMFDLPRALKDGRLKEAITNAEEKAEPGVGQILGSYTR